MGNLKNSAAIDELTYKDAQSLAEPSVTIFDNLVWMNSQEAAAYLRKSVAIDDCA